MKKRKRLSALCHILGTLILVIVIAACAPIAAPRLLGYRAFNIMSGSMEPEIPVGSLVYVKLMDPDQLLKDDVIAFREDPDAMTNGFIGGEEVVVVHRVVENHIVEGEIITKGDANAEADMDPVAYDSVIGRVDRHIPLLGQLMLLLGAGIGKVLMACLAVVGILLHVLAGRIRNGE